MNVIHVENQTSWSDYELLDSGNGRKLERYGEFILARPENQALWKPTLPENEWRQDASFQKDGEHGAWKMLRQVPNQWHISFENLKFFIKLTPFGHTGVFPEQAQQWKWIQNTIQKANRPLTVLSLFTYTGISTLSAASAGASVVHVDASGPAITWARENAKLSGLDNKPIRWIVDDALKFVKREARRGNKYDGIIMDPPKFGRGPKGEVWKFEKSFPELLDECYSILSPHPIFIIATAYAIPISSLTLTNMVWQIMKTHTGTIESGELTLEEKTGKKLLSTAIFTKWCSL